MSSFRFYSVRLATLAILFSVPATVVADDPFIPRKQSRPPGPPLSPEEAVAKMEVPEGFRVELVANEPQIMNPVAMAFDDRGRIYVAESFEYPRREPGPGRDTIKILEDTDGDGRVDNVKVFAEGLNIPSGIAVGYGGVFVANAPDILFLEDTDGDDRADKQTVVATGFGRDDTHELPNALTWGPDGFLYGLNGVFNRSRVTQGDQQWEFTCAMFRIDPVTHRFELFCEGTSNPWGIAFDNEGSAFVSACVIDHLWHLSQTGYYHRQAGAYPPHTWKIESIVDYKHQMAAYCGIEYFDSPAYPEPYRNKLYMGNIHGGCINVDGVNRHGSTYRGTAHPDFLTANDVWFMPVAQKVGPDGCLYVLDWYDRYHCYQDANADPQGVDRGHGRLYRIVYDQRPAIKHADLSLLEDHKLVDLLVDPNIFLRQRAAVLLGERLRKAPSAPASSAITKLLTTKLTQTLASKDITPFPLYLLTTTLQSPQLPAEQLQSLLTSPHPLVVAWTVRSLTSKQQSLALEDSDWKRLAADPDPRVRLQTAIAAGQLDLPNATECLLRVLQHSEDDGHLPRIVWANLLPRLMRDQTVIVDHLVGRDASPNPLLKELAPRMAARWLDGISPALDSEAGKQQLTNVLQIANSLMASDPQQASAVYLMVLNKLKTGELRASAASTTLQQSKIDSAGDDLNLLELRAFADDEMASKKIAQLVAANETPIEARLSLLGTIALTNPSALDSLLNDFLKRDAFKSEGSADDARWRDALFSIIVRSGSLATQQELVSAMPKLPVGLQATLCSQLCQRPATTEMLLQSISEEKLAKELVSLNDVRNLATSSTPSIRESVQRIWGTIRSEQSAERQQIVQRMTSYLMKEAKGDPQRGIAVYDRICGQCHQLHQRGFEVGPSLTRNGRGSFEQLIVSVFDPSLVIGDAYQSVSVLTTDGRLLTGIVLENSDQRIVLRVQGGKSEVIPQDDIEQLTKNKQSLMPEGIEQQMSPQELADLFALLAIEGAELTPEATSIPGTPATLREQ